MPSDRPDNTGDANPGGEALSIGTLLRVAADGELTAAQRATLDEHLRAHPLDQRRIDTDRALRVRVGRMVDQSPAASAELRESVRAILAGEQRDDAMPIRRPDRSFWRRSIAPFAIAAALLLAVSAAIIFRQASVQSDAGAWMTETQGAEVAGFVEREHSRCARQDDGRNMKFVTDSLDGAAALIAERLGAPSSNLDLSSKGLILTGAGACHVPGAGKSVHLLYRGAEMADAPPVSLFIQSGDPAFEGVDPRSLCLTRLAHGDEVLVWRRDGLVYYLVCPPGREAAELLTALDAPVSRVVL